MEIINDCSIFQGTWDRDAHEEILSESDTENESVADCRDGNNCENGDDHNLGYGFERLKTFIRQEENNHPMNLPITGDRTELLLAILKFSLVNELTQTAIADLFKLISLFFGVEFLPTTRYLVDKLFNNEKGMVYHACCPTCKGYVSEFERSTRHVNCNNCNLLINLRSPTYTDFFVLIDVRNEVANLLETHWEAYRENISTRGDGHSFSDFKDGMLYLEFLDSLPEEVRFFATFSCNTDGASITNSSGLSIWGMQLMINELPPAVRTANLLTNMMWFGKNKPDMTIFLKAFVLNMNTMSDEGVRCRIGNEVHEIKLFTLCSVVDTMARAPMQGLQQLGYYGCNWCLHPGIWVEPVARARGRRKRGSVKYVVMENILNRTEEGTRQHMQESLTSVDAVNGFVCPSWLINLRKFKIIRGFVPDPMHQLSGVAKQFLGKWLTLFTPAEKVAINSLMDSITVPSQVQRLSRKVEHWKNWKSLEFENWLLYYSLPILNSFPRFSETLKHWVLLVEAVHILYKKTVTRDEITSAHNLIKEFVIGTEEIYGPVFMTHNVHTLLHLAQSVLDWGPLWCHNCYSYENLNQKYLKQIKSTKGVIYQICRAVSMRQSELILRRHVASKEDSVVADYVHYLEYRHAQQTCKLTNARFLGWSSSVSEDLVNRLGFTMESRLFGKMVKGGCLYTSKRTRLMRSDNSYAMLSNGKCIQILGFVVDTYLRQSLTIANVFHVRSVFNDRNLPLFKIVGISHNNEIVDTDAIETICVAVKISDTTYLIVPPNLYHK
ncbi:hypothetical protein QAD02_011348 [Eretmocerus hayati]|uniref:Uncharacterized protein n=2 Tax=Eretmocerus hayati TaxID=131215 RepID=A0ACC2NWT3_9HYME|nr:hypothetical protein QAD02_010384 [Eretmocerus hayati]KAJ8675562.1 hypothetical protein QAD02_011348 [Eretmocerus hayati]